MLINGGNAAVDLNNVDISGVGTGIDARNGAAGRNITADANTSVTGTTSTIRSRSMFLQSQS